ncbi:MAG: PKD domain-containing protein, partial [Candidatus Cloacimonetes bacterium]|nr:PKD domain-containing protein [Candidatus Cloacimonadota bacterium]
MNNKKKLFILITLVFILCFSNNLFGVFNSREEIIENFDDGEVELLSYPGEDEDPDSWSLDSTITYNNSAYSLKLFGNTWKIEMIEPTVVDSDDVWQVSAYVQTLGEIQGFGVMDSSNVLFYSFAGSEQLNIEEWITVYQGNFPLQTWNIYQLPIADDWFAWFDYLPVITGIVFINDRDVIPTGTVYFDEIINITSDLPVPPEVEISYTIGKIYRNYLGEKSVDVQFYGEVFDPDSDEHLFYWNFGDDSTSTEQNPFHTF